MAGELFTLPLRLSVRCAQLVFRTTEAVAGRAWSIAGQALQRVAPSGSDAIVADQDVADRDVAGRDVAPRVADRDLAVPDRDLADRGQAPRVAATETTPLRSEETARRAAAPPEPAAQPDRVSTEPELVRGEAEPGAEEGAGAEVTVIAPWQGYERMTAQQVIERLATASPAELATIRLYESSNRSRQTVLSEVDRQLKKQTGRARPE